MTELLTSAQMRAIEGAAMDAGAVTGLELMERAGEGVVDRVFAWQPELAKTPHRACVVCGPGNNGGDGYVIARLLAQRGWAITVLALGVPQTADAKLNAARWGGAAVPLTLEAFRSECDADLFVDALFGTGLARAPEGALLDLLRYWSEAAGDKTSLRRRTVAVDAPSGLCLDSGRALAADGTLPAAGLTVTFEGPKLGHFLGAGPRACARLEVVDLGLSRWRGALGPLGTKLVDRKPWAAPCANDAHGPHLDFSKGQGHKYDHGHVGVVSGGMGRSGAARLAARGALRVGAGAVTLAAPGAAMMECATQVTAVMLRKCDTGEDLKTLVSGSKLTTLVVGPGLGLEEKHVRFVEAALDTGLPCVLDADALTLIARHLELREKVHAACILTPHMGEFRRLCPDLAAKLQDDHRQPAEDTPSNSSRLHEAFVVAEHALTGPAFSKVDAVRNAAARLKCTVLLKGPDTVIAEPDGRAYVHAACYDRAAPWLATAGSGDVLAGVIAGRLALSGTDCMTSAAQGAWLHAEAARAFGPGLIAEDLPEMMPIVLQNELNVSD